MFDTADIRGNRVALRALEVAAAGGHGLLLRGPQGAPKTIIARRLQALLPPLRPNERDEIAEIWSSVPGMVVPVVRPFRAPHHTISDAGLGGGGPRAYPGEVSLAHAGVLYLEDLPDFECSALEVLRAVVERGEAVLVRHGELVRYAARPHLVASMDPCPCGFARGRCVCDAERIRAHRQRIDPLRPLLDLCVEVDRPGYGETWDRSSVVAERVAAARERQTQRGALNASMRDPVETLLRTSFGPYMLELARSVSDASLRRLLRVAQTIADLAGSPSIQDEHAREARMLTSGIE